MDLYVISPPERMGELAGNSKPPVPSRPRSVTRRCLTASAGSAAMWSRARTAGSGHSASTRRRILNRIREHARRSACQATRFSRSSKPSSSVTNPAEQAWLPEIVPNQSRRWRVRSGGDCH